MCFDKKNNDNLSSNVIDVILTAVV